MEKSCKSCKFYVPHYVIRDGLGLYPVEGHCIKCLRNGHRNEKLSLCKHYEKLEKRIVLQKKRKTARQLLEVIEEKLENVVTFLEH